MLSENYIDVTEEWRPLAGYEGRYEVSSCGRVKSLVDNFHRPRSKILLPNPNHAGYLRVKLQKDGGKWTAPVHRLVAEAFLGPRPDGMTVNHKNGAKEDNRPENLEYMSARDNRKHAWRTGLNKLPVKRLTAEQAAEIKSLKGVCSQRQIGLMFEVSEGFVQRIHTGKRWRCLV